MRFIIFVMIRNQKIPNFDLNNVKFLGKSLILNLCISFITKILTPSLTSLVLISSWSLSGNRYLSEIVHLNQNLPSKKGISQTIYTTPILGYLFMYNFIDESLITSYILIHVGIIIGLHFGFLDALPLFRDFDITPSKMKLWKWPQWTLFYSIILLLSSLISYILPFISKNLAIKYFSVIAIITIITYLLYPKYEIHLHHFFIASFFYTDYNIEK